MKKIILSLVFGTLLTTANAQTETARKAKKIKYNKWSVELAGGFNKPQRPLTSGYYVATISPFTVDLGARYMLNNKFGLKGDFGYNSLTSDNSSLNFDSKFYRANLQGVFNLGRVLNFETWTKTIGLLAHTGLGVAQLDDKNSSKKDRMGNFIAGVTGQIKLTNQLVLTGDMTLIQNSRQAFAFDFASFNDVRGFSGSIFTGTVGLTMYLGKRAKHTDWEWIIENNETENKIQSLEKRIAELETLSNDSDRDGVVDYLDVEPNSIGGVMVDTKGRAIDLNSNGVPDELENYLSQKYTTTQNSALGSSSESVKNLINGGYVSTYFDYGKSTPTNVSTEGIDFVMMYLRNNPSASIDIIGHADEVGKSKNNEKLSNARANSVKNTLVKAGIDASRLNIIAAGEDTSVDINSIDARKLVRRVTFRVR